MKKGIKRLLTAFLTGIMTISALVIPASAEKTYGISPESVIEKVNERYGTSIRLYTDEEIVEKLGVEALERKETKLMSESEALEYEKHLIYVAEHIVPLIEENTEKAMQRKKDIMSQEKSAETIAPAYVNYETINAEKAINYATAGVADANIIPNDYGGYRWGSIGDPYCLSNAYSERWFLAGVMDARVIDTGRTILWEGTGDYGGYVNGTFEYYGSGTQYAEMYIGKYAYQEV